MAFAQKKKKKNKKRTELVKQREVSSEDRKNFQFHFGEAMRYKLVHEFAASEGHLVACTKLDPSQPAPFFELSNIYYHYAKNLEGAVKYAKTAAEMDPSNFWYQVHYAECLYESGDHDNSIKVYQQMVNTFPEKTWIALQLAKILGQEQRLDDCIAVCNDIEKKSGPNEEVIALKVYAYLKLGKKQQAIDEQKRLISIYPEEDRYYFQLAAIYVEIGEKENALAVFDQLLQLRPNSGKLHLELAQFHYRNNDRKQSAKELKLAFEDPELDIDAKMKILLTYYDAVNLSPTFKREAFELNEILVRVHPKEAVAHTIYADFLYADKQILKAKSEFKKAVELDESRFPIWSQLILMEMELNAFDSVQLLCSRAQELFPNQPSLYYFNGIASIQLKQYDEAVRLLNSGLKLVVDNEAIAFQFYVSLGDAYHEQEKHNESDIAYERALDIDSSNANLLNNYSYYLSIRGEHLDKAERMAFRANELAPNQPSYLDTYAWVLYTLKRYEEAQKWIDKALLFGGDQSAEVLEHAGDIYYQTQQIDRAVGYWEKAKMTLGEPSPNLERKIRDKVLYE
jgi:tetratricopeptide (TPR) repeat protein